MTQFVPKQFVRGFQILRDLSDEDARRLIEAVDALPLFSALPTISEAVRESLPNDAQDNASAVVDSLLSLRGQLRSGNWTPADLSRRAAESEGIATDEPADRVRLQQRIERMILARSIASTASAADLLIQHERPYRSARVFTDVRPVFADDVTEPPQGAVIVENLQIEYWTKNGGRDVATFGLDEGDLQELKDVVDRAVSKTSTLRRFLESVGIEPFDVEGAAKASVDADEEEGAAE